MFCTDIPAPSYLVFSNAIPNLIYYSHIPTCFISLLLGFFVFFKSKTITSKLLLSISVVFSLWIFLNLIVWTNVDSRIIMFSWSLFGMLMVILFTLCLYFVYVFINKKDINLWLKMLLIAIVLPFILFNRDNTSGFDLVNCEAIEVTFYSYAVYFFEFVVVLWILIYSAYKYRKAEKEFKKQIIFLTIGIELFLFSFFVTGFLASYLVEKEVITDFGLEQYGLFGMTVFMVFLAYLIVKFKAFNIKVLATSALVVTQIVLIGSLSFYSTNVTSQTIILINLIITLGFGYMLAKSVRLEVERKEQLQVVSDKLSRANDQLRELDNAKSEFISIASHQLRTPLTAVKGYVSLLLEGSYGKVALKQKDVLDKVYQSNERLVNLVEDLLNLSRIESGRMEYNLQKVKIEGVMQEIFDTFIIRAKERNLSLDLVLPKTPLPEVMTDRNKIREIISNFTDNALKYTKEGGVKIRASVSGKNVLVAIEDTGIGIPKEEIPYLFAKFSRGKDVGRLNTGGTGLGLHVGKRMIEELHGRIWVESEGTGKGSTFFVEIPIEIEDKI